MTELKIDSRDVMTDGRMDEIYRETPPKVEWAIPKVSIDFIRVILNEALLRFAERAGVTGRKETGYAVTGNNGWTEFYQAGRVLAFPARATLYISDPPKPKASAEERIERALTLLRQNADLITGTTSQVYRTLRGED